MLEVSGSAVGRESAVPAAEGVLRAYEACVHDFLEITGRARSRFLTRDWEGGQRDAAERLEVYSRHVTGEVRRLAATGEPDGEGWKAAFAERVAERHDAELARTFFNSVVRRVLDTSGVDPATEFTADRVAPPDGQGGELAVSLRVPGRLDGAVLAELFASTEVGAHFAALTEDAEAAARAVDAQLGRVEVSALEALPFLFYRNKAAYLVARLRHGSADCSPLLVPLVHPPEGVRPDAVITDRDEVHRVFSFARSYFRARTAHPCETVAFLRTLMPAKPLHELFTAIGHNRHGKTELYRELTAALASPSTRLEPADGIPGLVMVVFTLPELPVVFKVIRDEFGPSKDVSHAEVLERYRFVFVRDRVGRLADAQEFEDVEFPVARFDPGLLEELLGRASRSVELHGEQLRVRHLYTERRLRPLDVFLREAEPAEAGAAVVEYGNAIRDLACANLFPGDLLLKNFGVTRHGRVVFYDYDEIALLTEMRFRTLPAPRTDDEEMSAEPWFDVGGRDVFPEQFLPFLIPPGPLRERFVREHGDILTVAFWRDMQARQQAHETPDFYPYPLARRLGWTSS